MKPGATTQPDASTDVVTGEAGADAHDLPLADRHVAGDPGRAGPVDDRPSAQHGHISHRSAPSFERASHHRRRGRPAATRTSTPASRRASSVRRSAPSSVMIGRDVTELEHAVGRHRADLLGRRQHVGVGRAVGERPLHRRFVGIAGRESGVGVHARHADEAGVGVDPGGGLGSERPARHDRVLEQAPADDEHVHPRVVGEGDGDGRAVGDDGRREVRGERLGEAQRGGAAVHDDRLARRHERRGVPGDGVLGVGRDRLAGDERGDRRGHREGAAVDPLQQAVGRQLAQVTADRVLRRRQLGGHVGGDEAPVAGQAGEQPGPAFGGEHVHEST